ncbi:MAG: hypothetical protein EAY76_01890 [Alphaproteobacteria bacterium]|nr:MAG: hypothetical protein EAY76_01890 [Alphaproteobacteria bacterium]TAF77239.1 MAG: hypothetical protein EAZ52_01520 [Alphaproteobacteria bacterium]
MSKKTDGLYQFSGDSPIAEIYFRQREGGVVQAFMKPKADATSLEIGDLPVQLAKKGIGGAYADVREGENVLSLPPMKDESQLIGVLQEMGMVRGAVQRQDVAREDLAKQSAWDEFRSRTIELSGYAAIPGYAAIFADGLWASKVRDPYLAVTAAGVVKPLTMLRYGSGDKNAEINHVIEGLDNHFYASGNPLPMRDDVSPERNTLEKVDDFIRKNSVTIAYTVGSAAAAAGMYSAVNQKKGVFESEKDAEGKPIKVFKYHDTDKDGKPYPKLDKQGNKFPDSLKDPIYNSRDKTHEYTEKPLEVNGRYELAKNPDGSDKFTPEPINWERLILNTTTFVGNGLVAILPAKEENPDVARKKRHDEAEKEPVEVVSIENVGNMIKGFGEFVGTKTMQFNGLFNFSDILCWARETMKEAHKLSKGDLEGNEQARPWLIGITTASLGASIILEMLSSKNLSQEEKLAQFDKIYATCAKSLLQMPEEKRAGTMQEMATYLAAQDSLYVAGVTSDMVKGHIEERLSIMEKSPWVRTFSRASDKADDLTLTSSNTTSKENIMTEAATVATHETHAHVAPVEHHEAPAHTTPVVAEHKPAEHVAPVVEHKPAEHVAPVAEHKPAEHVAPVAEHKPAELTHQEKVTHLENSLALPSAPGTSLDSVHPVGKVAEATLQRAVS